jgi:hypothetical protein
MENKLTAASGGVDVLLQTLEANFLILERSDGLY